MYTTLTTIEKTRTICVDGVMGRDKFRKIMVGKTVAHEKGDTNTAVDKHCSKMIDECLSKEIEALNLSVVKVVEESTTKKRKKLEIEWK